MWDPGCSLLTQTIPLQIHTQTQRTSGQSCDLSRLWPVWVKQSKSSCTQMSSWLLKQHSLSSNVPPLLFSSSFALLSLQPLWRLSDNQGRREEEGSRGRSGGRRGRRVVRELRCPDSGIFNPLCEGQEFLSLFGFGRSKRPFRFGARWFALSPIEPTDAAHTRTYTHILGVSCEDTVVVMRQWLMRLYASLLHSLKPPVFEQTPNEIKSVCRKKSVS